MGRARMVTSPPWGQLDSPSWSMQLEGSHGARREWMPGLSPGWSPWAWEAKRSRPCGENGRV